LAPRSQGGLNPQSYYLSLGERFGLIGAPDVSPEGKSEFNCKIL
jgi:hypothetical protein